MMKRLLMIFIAAFLVGAVVDVYPQFVAHTSAAYSDIVVLSTTDDYCPGDDLIYSVMVERKRKGPVNVREIWCRVGGFCAISIATEKPGFIYKEEDPAPVTMVVEIPDIRTMQAGQTWLYVHANYPPADPDDWDSYTVAFQIADDCQ